MATRENFVAANYDKLALERLKLEDGIHIHVETKVQLEVFARENGVKRVKPFMLVVAEDNRLQVRGYARPVGAKIKKKPFSTGSVCKAEIQPCNSTHGYLRRPRWAKTQASIHVAIFKSVKPRHQPRFRINTSRQLTPLPVPPL